jgi:hypothetical protein
MSTVAQSLAALDARWFTDVLREGGHATATVVTAHPEPMAFRGAVGEMARIRLEYDDSGDPGPASVIAKTRGTSEVQAGMDTAMGLYERESRFYAELGDRVPVGTPHVFHIGDGVETPLLMEDLGGLRVGDQMQGLSVPDAERTMDALGDLHAAFWNAPELDLAWIAQPADGVYAAMIVQLVASGVETLRERYAGRVPDTVLDGVGDVAPRWGDVLRRCAEGPKTLVHNDCRLDNVFFDGDGGPVFVDWQVVARTRGTQDVANLLAGSMNVEDLRGNWERLLRRYHDRLRLGGIGDYAWEDCVRHYRQNILYPLGAGIALLGQLDIGDDRRLGDAIVLRALNHVADLDCLELL